MAYKINQFDTREEWLSHRGIGGSEIAALLGLSHFQTPKQLWELKKNGYKEEIDDKTQLLFDTGHLLEPLVAETFAKNAKKEIDEDSVGDVIVSDMDYPFLTGSPDRTWGDKSGVLECKTTQIHLGEFSAIGELPKSWYCQLQWYMGLMGIGKGAIAYIANNKDYGHVMVSFDKEFFNFAKKTAVNWWNTYIDGDKEPEEGNAKAKILKPLDPQEVTASESVMNAIQRIKELSEIDKANKTEADALKQLITDYMNGHSTLTDIDGKGIAKIIDRAGSITIDRKKIESNYPDIFKECQKVGAPSRFLKLK